MKVCPVCEVHYDSTWSFCSNPCIEEGYRRAAKEKKIMDLIKENLASEMVTVNGFLEVGQKFRNYLAEREEYGVPTEYVDKILPIQSRDGMSQK